ncbi:hypothetical protein RJ640_001850 [Escallonia rubra]|uniref:Serine-threonine/tyrosine-protein kinase catalytic domain-containing protein n=1 Tax=Escallonia rubra TaxID=112253 RepID=A0AA88RSL2_9ASTE|nr:hypothetical protein RJ640_001850 [Escallonia rubra]
MTYYYYNRGDCQMAGKLQSRDFQGHLAEGLWSSRMNLYSLPSYSTRILFGGYMSPEYAMEGNFSIKSDVFSFGVLLLEIVSGRRNTSFYDLDRPVN